MGPRRAGQSAARVGDALAGGIRAGLPGRRPGCAGEGPTVCSGRGASLRQWFVGLRSAHLSVRKGPPMRALSSIISLCSSWVVLRGAVSSRRSLLHGGCVRAIPQQIITPSVIHTQGSSCALSGRRRTASRNEELWEKVGRELFLTAACEAVSRYP